MLPLALFIVIDVALSTSNNCSALHSYVFLVTETDVGSTITTLTSSQALFPPHSYYIPSTQLITLSNDDNICHPSASLSIDITNKVILLFEYIGNCSVHYKVLRAQEHGAIAVVMTNNDRSGNVVNIPGDNGIYTTIPMRSIGKREGKALQWFVQDAGHDVTVSFECFIDTLYPSMLCLKYNPSTWGWYPISGEYQRQASIEVNKHPVWKLNGYPLYHDDLYLFLDDAEGVDDWFWAITSDNTFANDSAVIIRCSVGDIQQPPLCPLWSEWNGTAMTTELNHLPHITLTDGVCPAGNQTLCIHSNQSQLSHVKGSYSLVTNDEAEWLRDLNECDQRGSILKFFEYGQYGNGYFALYELLTWSIVSLCVLPQQLNDNGYATTRYRPDLCTEWKIADNTQQYTVTDTVLSVSIDECIDTAQCVSTDIADTLCLMNSSIIYGSLMGEYIKLNDTGPYHGSPIYERMPPDDAYWMDDTVYIWHINEVASTWGFSDNIHHEAWILTDWSLERALEEGDYNLFGFCQGYAYGNPSNCIGWIFDGGWWQHYDEAMIVSENECTENFYSEMPDSWPSYICIGTGAYKLQLDPNNDNVFPVWVNIYDDSLYLSYQHHQWSIGNDDVEIKCDPYLYHTLNPIDCKTWLDKEYEVIDDIYLYECTDNFDGVCLSRNGTMQSLIEGIYHPTAHRNEFINSNDIYLGYDDSNWVLSAVDGNVYGYCVGESDITQPKCKGCWLFYWDSDDKYIEDCLFTLSMDLSVCEGEITDNIQYTDTLCVNGIADGDVGDLIGKYYIDVDDSLSYWNAEHSIYIKYDSITNHWLIGAINEVLVVCNGKMIECVMWDEGISLNIDNMISLSEECVVGVGNNKNGGSDDTVMRIVGGSLIVLFFCSMGGLVYCYYVTINKYNKGYRRRSRYQGKDTAANEMIQKSQLVTTGKVEYINTKQEDETDRGAVDSNDETVNTVLSLV